MKLNIDSLTDIEKNFIAEMGGVDAIKDVPVNHLQPGDFAIMDITGEDNETHSVLKIIAGRSVSNKYHIVSLTSIGPAKEAESLVRFDGFEYLDLMGLFDIVSVPCIRPEMYSESDIFI